MALHRCALPLVGSMLVACTAFAPVGDFASYRAYRHEPEGPSRLAAGSAYLSEYPHGRFQAEVTREVLGAEEDYWQEHRSSPDGLREYITAFPSGPHVEEAHQRQHVFEEARRQQEEERRAAQLAEQNRVNEQLRLQAVRGRVLTRIRFAHWLGVFGGLQGWGQGLGAIAQANPDFNTEFQAEPQPRCRGTHCRKDFRQEFTIPVPGRTAQSSAVLFTVDLIRSGPADARVLSQVGLVAHNRGLSHWWESEHQAAVDVSDASAREESIAWSILALRAAMTTLFPTAHETPANLIGPPPEPVMQGVEEDENATTEPTDPNACVVPSQPFGVRWSAVVGCDNIAGANFAASAEAVAEQNTALGEADALTAVTPHTCLRVDAYAALDAEGMSTDEGILITQIPACATQPAAPTRPVRPGRPARPAPARPAPAAH